MNVNIGSLHRKITLKNCTLQFCKTLHESNNLTWLKTISACSSRRPNNFVSHYTEFSEKKKFAGLQNHGQRIGKLEKINKCKKLLLTRLNLILRFEVLKLLDCHHFHTPYFREINFSVKSHGNVRMILYPLLCSWPIAKYAT